MAGRSKVDIHEGFPIPLGLMDLETVPMDRNYLWPPTLRMSVRPPKIVYLDLNHWITLAQIVARQRDGERDKELLSFCLESVESNSAVYPISLSTYTEIHKIQDRERRRNLRRVIEGLGHFMVVTSRAVVATHEIETVLDQRVGPNPVPISTVDYLDWGVYRAMGMAGDIKVTSASGEDITALVRQRFADGPEAFDRIVSEAQVDLNRQVLDGPSQDEEAEIRRQGYNPEAILEEYEREATAEAEWARLLDSEPRWRRGRLRDLVSARELLNHINSILERGCNERGVGSLESLFPSVNDARAAFDSMPSFDVSVTLKTSIHKNSNHRWRNNDVHDIHALAVAIPYCDIVVTDRAMVSQAVRSKLARRLNTVVLSDLYQLPQYLGQN